MSTKLMDMVCCTTTDRRITSPTPVLTVEVITVPNHVTERRERTHAFYVIQGLSREGTVERESTFGQQGPE